MRVDGDPTKKQRLLQALTESMNDHRAMGVPLAIGIAWSASESDNFVKLTAISGIGLSRCAGGASSSGTRPSRVVREEEEYADWIYHTRHCHDYLSLV
jgi:hypothetical protein